MLHELTSDSPLASYEHHPVCDLEPGAEIVETQEQREQRIEREAYREAAIKSIVFMHGVMAFIHEARSPQEQAIRLWVVSSTISHPACQGRSDSDLANMCDTTRANFSKHKLAFQRRNSLPPNLSQKSVEARKSYRQARISQLKPIDDDSNA